MSSSFTTSTVNNNTNNTNNNNNKSQHDDVVVIEPHDNNFSNSNSNISSSSSSSSPKQDTNDITLYVSDMLSQMVRIIIYCMHASNSLHCTTLHRIHHMPSIHANTHTHTLYL